MDRRQLGKYGENLAAEFLKKNGFEIIERNYRTRWGEIDLIAAKGDSLRFIEVKTRLTKECGEPEEAIHWRKKRNLLGAAKLYIACRPVQASGYQIDAVSIVINPGNKTANVRHLENIVLD